MKSVCSVCNGNFKVNSNGRLRVHKKIKNGKTCPGSGAVITEEVPEAPRKRPTPHQGSWRSGILD